MNILPKKRWHVRTKDNVARVRRDEAQAAAEEKARLERAALAEQEARTRFLREKATQKRTLNGGWIVDVEKSNNTTSTEATHDVEKPLISEDGHVNFFADLEEQERTFGTNKDYEKEKRLEKEAEERKIGLLKYLGEGSSESMKETPWYQKVPERNEKLTADNESKREYRPSDGSFDRKEIIFPSDIGLLPKRKSKKTKNHKHKKSKKRKRDSDDDSDDRPSDGDRCETVITDLDKLRAERLKRENEERLKSELLLRQLRNGQDVDLKPKALKNNEPPAVQQKYSSQFNPQFARQNR